MSEDAPAKVCATCKWWDRADDARERYNQAGEGWHVCRMTVYDGMARGDDPHRAPGTLASALDHDNYRAELSTAPTFGCVMWEVKG